MRAALSVALFLLLRIDMLGLAGLWADLLVLRSDPLASIKNVRTIETVWIAGNKVN